MTKEVTLEKNVADLRSCVENQSNSEESRWRKSIQLELVAVREQIEQHRAMGERVEVHAAAALNATHRELNKQQEALASLADFTDSAIKDFNSRYDALNMQQVQREQRDVINLQELQRE